MTNDKEKVSVTTAASEVLPSGRKLDRSAQTPEHLIPLPGSNWSLWNCAMVRGAGFPASCVMKLSSHDCASAADNLLEVESDRDQFWEETFDSINQELDELKLKGEWENKEKRDPLLKAMRKLKSYKLPRTDDLPSRFHAEIENLKAREPLLETAREKYLKAYAEATEQTTKVIYEFARWHRLQEAMIWQNRTVFHTGLIPLLRDAEEGVKRSSKQVQREELIANYLQRYCVKNDTVGFFGPVGWAKMVPDRHAIIANPGPSLIESRHTYFEDWCIDALAEKLSKDKRILPWVAPRRKPIIYIEGTTLYMPFRGEIHISVEQAAVLLACDGQRTAKQIATGLVRDPSINLDDESEVFNILESMRARGLISWAFDVPIGVHPDQIFRKMIERVEDVYLRKLALNDLDNIDEARNAVTAAVGDVEKLDQALGNLETAFTSLTGAASTRAAGKMYAGRTLIYEDCRRNIDVKIGTEILNVLGPPLSLLLTSARWLTYEIGKGYKEIFKKIYYELASGRTSSAIDFVKFWQRIQPFLFGQPPQLGDRVAALHQQKWAEILSVDPDQQRISYNSEELRPKVLSAFNAPSPGWRWARYHSPDFMIAAPNLEGIERGDFTLIVGEFHMGVNSLSPLFFLEQHPSKNDLIQASSYDVPPPRVVPFPPKSWPTTVTRTHFALVSPEDFSLEFEGDSGGVAQMRGLAIGALVIEDTDDGLVVRTRDGQLQFDIMEVFSHSLSVQTVNNFKIVKPTDHSPRVTFDRLVISRETWRFPVDQLSFVYEKSETDRFVETRRWAHEHHLPRFVFVKVPIEIKPFYLDLDSPIYVDIFAKYIRRLQESDMIDPIVTVTEMLPDPSNLWLPDAEGQLYTSEIRIVAVDPEI